MALKSRHSASSEPATSDPLRDFPRPYDPGCCDSSDRHRSLVLTQLDGTTEGFPLTWLYRWRWRKLPDREVLTLTLTEHEVTIDGEHLDRILEHLQDNHGLHLKIRDDRYFTLRGKNELRISTIKIQPNAKPSTELN